MYIVYMCICTYILVYIRIILNPKLKELLYFFLAYICHNPMPHRATAMTRCTEEIKAWHFVCILNTYTEKGFKLPIFNNPSNWLFVKSKTTTHTYKYIQYIVCCIYNLNLVRVYL